MRDAGFTKNKGYPFRTGTPQYSHMLSCSCGPRLAAHTEQEDTQTSDPTPFFSWRRHGRVATHPSCSKPCFKVFHFLRQFRSLFDFSPVCPAAPHLGHKKRNAKTNYINCTWKKENIISGIRQPILCRTRTRNVCFGYCPAIRPTDANGEKIFPSLASWRQWSKWSTVYAPFGGLFHAKGNTVKHLPTYVTPGSPWRNPRATNIKHWRDVTLHVCLHGCARQDQPAAMDHSVTGHVLNSANAMPELMLEPCMCLHLSSILLMLVGPLPVWILYMLLSTAVIGRPCSRVWFHTPGQTGCHPPGFSSQNVFGRVIQGQLHPATNIAVN